MYYLPVFLFLLCCSLWNCQHSESPRTYTEIAPRPQGAKAAISLMNSSPVDLDLEWSKPDHWILKDSSNGMRAASFAIPDSLLANTGEISPDAIDVSVTYFAGDAGGLKANVMRWLGQISVTLDSARLENFIQAAEPFLTQTGEAGILVDFTELLSGDLTQSKSIFGAIVPGKGFTLFVKGMGIRSQLKGERESIRAFCRSLKLKSGDA